MNRVNAILRHPIFIENLAKNVESEVERIFCKHGITHLLDVARIAQIANLEQQLELDKEHIYAAALLHDITKWLQQQQDIPHHQSAIQPADKILADCDFDQRERELICGAIFHHRKGTSDQPLAKLIFMADKSSRTCFTCNARHVCKKTEEKKLTFLER